MWMPNWLASTARSTRSGIEVKKLSGKLSNAKFVDNAPAEVVAKERQKLEEFEGSVSQLQEKRSAIAEMA